MLALLDLPDELVLLIALQCDDVADVARFARTCTALHALITRTDHFWSLMLARHFNVHTDDDAGARGSLSAGASSCAAVDHRALFRDRCTRLEWGWPADAARMLCHVDGDRSRVHRRVGASVAAALSEQALPWRGVSVVCVTTTSANTVGLVLCDRSLDQQWVCGLPPEGVLRATVDGMPLRCHAPATSIHVSMLEMRHEPAFRPHRVDLFARRPVDAPVDLYLALDAGRGRVYCAVCAPIDFALAFADARFAGQHHVHVFVTLVRAASDAAIRRVALTDEIRARLQYVDQSQVAAGRAAVQGGAGARRRASV